MSKIISVVPNISEGNDQQFISALVQKLKNIENLLVLDVSCDSVRNRTVFSFTGPKAAIFAGGLTLYRETLKQVDMSKHKGQYPRLGAVDVFPFVPLKDATIEETVAMAVEFAQKVAAEFDLPVYLFSEAARFPMRRYIENIREGEYEGLEQKLKDPRWKPDYGPDTFNPSAGATIIGARHPLLSFTAFLDSGDITVARALSEIIKHANGGLSHVNAYAGMDSENNLAEITVTNSNYRAMPMYRVLEMLRSEAKRFGATVRRVEMIGLIPENVFIESAFYYMGIRDFSLDKILERKIQTHLDETKQAN
ncbi:MAG: glutamate formimidoyltransferase [Candidatus Aminicenantes bacterium]|nr:glutamate formimidoyltransferase [Candidatus Aminicenantes bacterium]